MESERIPFKEAARRLGISENTLRDRIRKRGIRTYCNPRDMRQVLLDRAELEEKTGIRMDEENRHNATD